VTANGYALDMVSPVRHVATVLEQARPRALTIPDLVAEYTHPNPGDLSRVCQHEGARGPRDAETWLVREAVAAIARRGRTVQVEEADGGYRLAVPFGQLRYQGRPVVPNVNEHELLRDAFNPLSGRFSENVRRRGNLDLDELRESMREFGWVEEFPAIQDERGVVLVGHRRLTVAKELGIDPVVKTVTLGRGDAADAQRFRLAIVSNLASKPLTKGEREDLSEYLYREREWTIPQIAKALNVNPTTISRGLRGVLQDAKPPSRGGRPRGTSKPRRAEVVENRAKVQELFDAGHGANEIEVQTGLSANTVSTYIRELRAEQKGREQARVEAAAELAREQREQRERESAEPADVTPVEPEPVGGDAPEHVCVCAACGNMHLATV
jgi:ParB-like chromosome segregation protein Spo0J